MIGSVVSAFIVVRINIQTYIVVALLIGLVSIASFNLATSMEWIAMTAFVFGFAISAIYHSFMAWGISYIENPSYKHITYIYFCGGVGGTIAPYITSKTVEWFTLSTVFFLGGILYGIILILMFAVHLYYKNKSQYNYKDNLIDVSCH